MEVLEQIKTFFIHNDSANSTLAKRIVDIVPAEKIQWVNTRPFADRDGRLSSKEFSESKQHLFVAPFRGKFFKRCPGSRPGLTCCNYFVLNLGLQCNMNCSYCYLQSFINTPVMTAYSNLQDALCELEDIGRSMADHMVRIGTGEVIDSLSLDPITLFSHDLIHFFRRYPKWRLEFKTKSDAVDQFLDVPHAGNIIVSWSINPQNIIDKEEHGTASLDRRLRAAVKCRDKGFLISFHIDPMIWHKGWEKNYSELVEKITTLFRPEEIPAISVGALRFQPEQRHMMRERFGMDSLVNSAETFKCSDGKLRYDGQLRRRMYEHVVNAFKNKDSKWNIFLCMETPETWLQSMPSLPGTDPGLKDLFYNIKMPKPASELGCQ
ncbi:MAG: radical SAM protein [Pseudobdellovibrionaceae bacterium]|nr:hypothetical protein [Bdellovibrionales bacterium]USN48867.1 MAG: radical SAM protein [Pseudobdellovibrionaceae bacterium]